MSDAFTDGFGDLLPDWSHIDHQYLGVGVPGIFVLREDPPIHLFADEGGRRFGIRFAASGEPPVSRSAVEVRQIVIDGRRHLELSIDRPVLYRTFYSLAGQIAAAVIRDGADAEAAADGALRQWRALLLEDRLLGEERQIGLFGELWALDRLLTAGVIEGVECWTGPDQESHDLRLAAADFEVKTTVGPRRVHTVTSLAQLEPSPGVPLFLLSLRVQDGGEGGHSLPVLADRIAARLPAQEALRFRQRLELAGYFDHDREHYPARRRPADPPRLIAVDDGCPRLVRSAVSAIPSAFAPDRIVSASYRIDVEGLGALDGDPEFHLHFPPVSRPDTEA